MDHLAVARKALDRSRPDRAAALDALVAAWQALRRPPAVAELVEVLAAEIDRSLEPIDDSLGDRDYQAAWLGRAAGAGRVGLSRLLPGLFRGPLGAAVGERFDLLSAFADDPRTVAAFGRMIADPPFTARSNFGVWTKLFRALEASPDPRLRPIVMARLSSLGGASQFWPMLQRRCLALLAKLPAQAPSLTDAQQAQVEALRERIAELAAAAPAQAPTPARDHTREAELLARIHEEPDNLDHRAVWADALLARGDPRGEFIQLQLADHDAERAGDPRSVAAGRKRQRKLLEQHGAAWLGELAAVIDKKQVGFEDGFPARAEVRFDSQTERGLIGNPAWATLREVDCSDLEFLCDPSLRSLRRAGGFAAAQLRTLVEQTGPALPWTSLGPILLDQVPPMEHQAIARAKAERLIHARALSIHLGDLALSRRPDDYAWLLDSALGQRLEHLRISAFPDNDASDIRGAWAGALARWPQLQRLDLDLFEPSLSLLRTPGGQRLQARSGRKGTLPDYTRQDVLALLQALAPTCEALEFISTGAAPIDAAQLQRLVTRAGFTRFEHHHRPGGVDESGGWQRWRRWQSYAQRQEQSERRLERSRRELAAAERAEAAGQPKPRPKRHASNLVTRLAAPLADQRPYLRSSSTLDGPLRWGRTIRFDEDGRHILFLAERLVCLRRDDLGLEWVLETQEYDHIQSFDHDPRDGRLWIGTMRGHTLLWDLAVRGERARARHHSHSVNHVAIARFDDCLLSAAGKALKRWQQQPGLPLLPTHDLSTRGGLRGLVLDPGGYRFATLDGHRDLRIHDLRDPKQRESPIVTRGDDDPGAELLRWAPADNPLGDHLATAHRSGHVRIWGVDGRALVDLPLHAGQIHDLTWTRDGRRLITLGADRMLRVSDSETGDCLLEHSIEPGWGYSVAVDPKAEILAIGGHDRVLTCSLADGREIARYAPHGAP